MNNLIYTMMKHFILLITVACLAKQTLLAQQNEKDSILSLLKTYTSPGYETDTNYINTFNNLAFRYNNINPDSSIMMSHQAIELSNRINYPKGKADALKNIGLAYNVKSDYINALRYLTEALQTAIASGYKNGASRIYQNTAIVYSNLGKYPESLENYYKALKYREEVGDKLGISSTINGIGTVYFMQGRYEDARINYEKALLMAKEINYTAGIESAFANIGEIYFRQRKYSDAEKNLLEALKFNQKTENKEAKAFVYYILASIDVKQGQYESAMKNFMETKKLATEIGSQEYECRSRYGMSEVDIAQNDFSNAILLTNKGIEIANKISSLDLLRDGHELLSRIYEKTRNGMQAFNHHKQFKRFADSINNQQTEQRAQNLAADYEYSKKEILLKAEQEKKEIAFQKKSNQQRWIIFSVLAALFSAVVVASLIFRSRQKEKKSNLLLHQKNIEIDKQKTTVEQTLSNLKATQQQLIQSEKMASLGELTAGIAHEIQNPLNFVNNFSEVNTELIDELREERKKEVRDFKNEDDLLNDIKENEQKINHHGKRADAIVKGMLQHSRSSSGTKEPTDINVLADEYLRLAYHGLRAKDKSFNATMKTEYEEGLQKVNVIPQDMGRVILNLITNAFYAAPLPPEGGFKEPTYKHEPTIWVRTKKVENKVLISVRDNGPGISQKVLDKIFQPFFTTKPTGQGTGLGLSLAYDIVKAHGGELMVETKEGEGSEFIIQLPI